MGWLGRLVGRGGPGAGADVGPGPGAGADVGVGPGADVVGPGAGADVAVVGPIGAVPVTVLEL